MAHRGIAGAATRIAAIVLLVFAAPVPRAAAAEGEDSLPVPRFVSLHSDRVNLRTGPGDRYPIEWVLTRKDMPVEIIGQLEHWRHIRDWQGTEGWVHARMLAGKRQVIVKGVVRPIYAKPDKDAALVARAEPGVIAKLLECKATWCRVEAGEVTGWIQRADIWGVFPDENVP